jgi:hypothetical protein
MSLDNFNPEVWSQELLANLHKAHVYGSPGVVNTDYEGDIRSAGDTVRINSIGAVTVFDYTKNSDMSAPETLTDAQATLVVDQAKAFNFAVDDIDKAQQSPKVMAAAMGEAAYALRDAADTYVAAMYTQAAAGNLIGSTGSPVTVTDPVTASNKLAYAYLVDLGVKLDEANVPSEGRFAIVPPWYEGLLLLDNRFVGYGGAAQDARLVNGQIGRAAGFDIYKSNNVPYAAGPIKYRITAGHPMAWSFAAQITSVEAYRPEKRFADAVKGLYVYGAKVVKPAALAVLTANFS